MRFLFDFIHPAHINFYKHLVYRLREEGHEITITCLQRGKIPRIVQEEFPDFDVTPIGHYARSRLGLYLKTGIWRTLELAAFIARHRPDASLTVAAFQVDFLSRLFRFPSLGAYDDPGHTNFKLSRRFLCCFVLPECLGCEGGNIVTFKGLKEWAYLSPKYFKPDPGVLEPYGLKPKEYIFVRDVETVSLNYRGQKSDPVRVLYDMGLSDENVLLSLENKALTSAYSNWQILQEPVTDIHSLMYYSKLVLSSGDSMAREGAELGVTGVYCGERLMAANRALLDLGYLQHITDQQKLLNRIRSGSLATTQEEQQKRRERLLNEWDDPNEIMYRQLMNLVRA